MWTCLLRLRPHRPSPTGSVQLPCRRPHSRSTSSCQSSPFASRSGLCQPWWTAGPECNLFCFHTMLQCDGPIWLQALLLLAIAGRKLRTEVRQYMPNAQKSPFEWPPLEMRRSSMEGMSLGAQTPISCCERARFSACFQADWARLRGAVLAGKPGDCCLGRIAGSTSLEPAGLARLQRRAYVHPHAILFLAGRRGEKNLH